eukprot:TRINITY_DN377_c1_g2_i2.p1 TRINITY_DN377_c1_g2~~TRINITY_DN377_c1_g2_i2.p1  ORF type:complete len:486 (+),score=50.24 TRINITY_DN377_c1_g2_i2:201-1460(+)
MSKQLITYLVLLSLLIGEASTQAAFDDVFGGPNTSLALSTAQARFAVDLMGQICEQQNCVFSPYSIFNLLSMVTMGAKGNTSAQMMNVLQASQNNFENNLEFHEKVGHLKSNLLQANDVEGVEFRVADNVFVGNIPLRALYESDLKEIYDVIGPQVVDFADQSASIAAINDFVSNVTKGEIQDFLGPDSLDPATLAVLVNAFFYKGSWNVQFDEEKTKLANFTKSRREKIEVQMMQVQGEFRYSQARAQYGFPKFDILELPYENPDFCMNILLPYTPLNDARDDIKANDLLVNFDLRLPREPNAVIVNLPKFTVSVKTDIKQALIELGMLDLFDQDQADLSGMIGEATDPIYVSNVIHEAKLEVNEQGTKATATTAIGLVFESSIDMFEVSQPFMFTIMHKPTKAVLLMGQVVDPSQAE